MLSSVKNGSKTSVWSHAGRPHVNQKGVRPSLPRHRAFVVQFGAEADLEAGRYTGRVDLHCPFCQRVQATLTALVARYGD